MICAHYSVLEAMFVGPRVLKVQLRCTKRQVVGSVVSTLIAVVSVMAVQS